MTEAKTYLAAALITIFAAMPVVAAVDGNRVSSAATVIPASHPDPAAFQDEIARLRDMVTKGTYQAVAFRKVRNGKYDTEIESAINLDPYFSLVQKALTHASTNQQILDVLWLQLPGHLVVTKRWEGKNWIGALIDHTVPGSTHDYEPEYRARRAEIFNQVQSRFKTANSEPALLQEFDRLQKPLLNAKTDYQPFPVTMEVPAEGKVAPRDPHEEAFTQELTKLEGMTKHNTYRAQGVTKQNGNYEEIESAVNLEPYFQQLEKALALAGTPQEILKVLRNTIPDRNLIGDKRWENKRFGLHQEGTNWTYDFGPEYRARLARLMDQANARFEAGHPDQEQSKWFADLRKPLGSSSASYTTVPEGKFTLVVPAARTEAPKDPRAEAFATELAKLENMMKHNAYRAVSATKGKGNYEEINSNVDLEPYFQQLDKTLALASTPQEILSVLRHTIPDRNLIADKRWENKRFGLHQEGTTWTHDFGPQYRERLARLMDQANSRFEAGHPDKAQSKWFTDLRRPLGSSSDCDPDLDSLAD